MLTTNENLIEDLSGKEKKNKKYSFVRFVVFMSVLSLFFGGLAGCLVFFALFQKIPLSNSAIPENVKKSIIEMSVLEDSATIDVVKKVSPSVVSIVISKNVENMYNQTGPLFPFEFFYDLPEMNLPEGKQQVGSGTGFIFSEDGYVLTNKHVVNDATAEYMVILSDGTQYPATVLGTDVVNDIGVLKIDAKGLPAIELGDSESLQIGQTVIAIGNSLGKYANTVTKGVVSGIGRKVQASGGGMDTETIESAIQTDAAINFGNSGGPLLNLAGQVIGVNTAINLEGQLIGFAIPINEAKNIIQSVREHGKIVRSYLGVRYIIIDENVASVNNLKIKYGALIIRGKELAELAVQPGSPADKAGLLENDIILEVNGEKIDKDNDLAKKVSVYKPGDTIDLKISHKGADKMVKVVLEEFPQ